MTFVLVCGEGSHDIGQIAWHPKTAEEFYQDGWMQPIIRKVLGDDVKIRTKRLRDLVVLPRPHKLKPIPAGHSDKAAIAKLISALEGCAMIVFMTDADSNLSSDTAVKINQIEAGFELIENDVCGVACVPQSTSESWLLADATAWLNIGLPRKNSLPKDCPEDLWGIRNERKGNHPKNVFARIAKEAGVSDDRETRRRLATESDLATIRTRCPNSFEKFVSSLSYKRISN